MFVREDETTEQHTLQVLAWEVKETKSIPQVKTQNVLIDVQLTISPPSVGKVFARVYHCSSGTWNESHEENREREREKASHANVSLINIALEERREKKRQGNVSLTWCLYNKRNMNRWLMVQLMVSVALLSLKGERKIKCFFRRSSAYIRLTLHLYWWTTVHWTLTFFQHSVTLLLFTLYTNIHRN